jgi:hypothetical protein
MAQSGKHVLTIEFRDGMTQRTNFDGLTLGLENEEPKMALLLPAVSVVREAARRMEEAVTKKENIPKLTVTTISEDTLYRWKLKKTRMTSNTMHVNSSS